jgi:flagellar motor switch protein FliG
VQSVKNRKALKPRQKAAIFLSRIHPVTGRRVFEELVERGIEQVPGLENTWEPSSLRHFTSKLRPMQQDAERISKTS